VGEHRCIGDDCLVCQARITEREFGPIWDTGSTDAAERDYERFYDRMWGDA
jgi:hypothetical protein